MTDSMRPRRPEYLKAVIDVLHESGGELTHREVMDEVTKRLNPTEFEMERHAKTGNYRWWASLSFDSIRLVKAGWLRKKRGKWYLTEEGAKQIQLSPEELFRKSRELYLEWKQQQHVATASSDFNDESDDVENASAVTFEAAVELAESGIREHILKKDGYDFQDLVAALLRGMGYHTPFVAPPGKDGGIDIIAYRDPLGMQEPRIRVQVKHRPGTKAGARDIREFISLLNKQGDSGLFVSSAGFSADAKSEIRHSNVHIEMMDLEDLIAHWEDVYDRLSEDDRSLLPLRKIAFLAPDLD